MKNLLASLAPGRTPDAKLDLSVAIGSTIIRQILSSGLYFIALWITTRQLGPHDNGLLATTLLLPQMLYAMLNMGLGPSHVFHLSSGAGNPISMRNANWILACALWAAVFLVLAMSGERHIATYLPGIGKDTALFASLLFPVMLLAAWSSALIQGHRDYRIYNRTLLIQPSMFCGAVIVLGATGTITVVSVLCSHIASQLALWLLCEARARAFARAPSSTRYTLFEAVKYGLRAHVSNVITFMNYRIALYLVSYLLGPAETGKYALAVQLAEVMWLISGAASTIIFPEAAAHNKAPLELKKMIEKVAASVVKITLAGALLAAMLATFAIPWIFGKDYQGAVIPYIILLPGVVAWSYMSVISNSLAGMGHQYINIQSALLCLAINIVGNCLAIPAWGLNGAAMVSTLAFSAAALYTVARYQGVITRRVNEQAKA